MSRDDRIEYLERERKKIWEKVLELEEAVINKTSDYESSAKDSSEQAHIMNNTLTSWEITLRNSLIRNTCPLIVKH